jgi:hypothetical protein
MICFGRAKMIIPSGGAHCRSAEFLTPAFDDSVCVPVVIPTVYAPASVGTTFGVYSIKVNPYGVKSQIAIEAQNLQIGLPSDLEFWCDFVAIGTPLESPVHRKRITSPRKR